MKLSIITINYNNASGLKRTIESIVPYCSQDIEYIVIDGGSSDNSVEYIKEYAGNINYWVSEPDNGIFHAMNKGLARSSGEYLLFMNSGDILNEGIDFTSVISRLSGEDIIYYDIIVADEANNKYIHPSHSYLDFKFFAERSLPHQATFIRKNVLSEYGGYNENMKIGSDWAFFIDAICLMGCSYKHIGSEFSTYYLNGISSRPDNHALLWEEKESHIKACYKLYYSLYKDILGR